ncbi:MAG: FtsX-like permease family protein [Candidatus Saccharimonadales bacterium]
MIRLTDTTTLAFTKLRARKIRTTATVALASLLFGVLAAASLVTTGAFKSLADFRADGLTSRYIVAVDPAPSGEGLIGIQKDPAMVAEAKKRFEALVAQKTEAAKELNISYNSVSEIAPYALSADGKTEMLQMHDSNNIVRTLLRETFQNKPVIDDIALQKSAKTYGATTFFATKNYHIENGATLNVLPKTGEVFYDQNDEIAQNQHYTPPIIDGNALNLAPKNITEPFLLAQHKWQPTGESIPIILPQETVELLLETTPLPDDAPAADKNAYLHELRDKAAGLTFAACYRNGASNAAVQQTVVQQNEIATHKNDKEFIPPALQYQLPNAASCTNPTVASDTRTDAQKQQDAAQKQFDETFATEPSTQKSFFVHFSVVGISPNGDSAQNSFNEPEERAKTVQDIAQSILTTSGIGQVIPEHLWQQIPAKERANYAELFTYQPSYFFGNEDNHTRHVEFATATGAQQFIDQEACTFTMYGDCAPAGRDYMATLMFTNSAAIDDLQRTLRQWFLYAMIGVMALAAVIMWLTVGRTIADGRHETAVFRAIGFTRSDIASVYVVYTLLLALLVAILATSVGFLGAYAAQHFFAPQLTALAQYNFGGLDLAKEVSLLSIDSHRLLLILAAIFATGLLSMIVPLLGNVRRSPIKDMREE